MKIKRVIKSIFAMGLATTLAFISPVSVFAGDGYTLSGQGGIQLTLPAGKTLETQDFSTGAAAYVNSAAIKSAMGTSSLHQYFLSDNWIPGISSYTLGSNAAASALQYSGTGFDQKNVKKGQYNSLTDTWSQPDYTDGAYFLTYRFA